MSNIIYKFRTTCLTAPGQAGMKRGGIIYHLQKLVNQPLNIFNYPYGNKY